MLKVGIRVEYDFFIQFSGTKAVQGIGPQTRWSRDEGSKVELERKPETVSFTK